MTPLSDATNQRLHALFVEGLAAEARTLLSNECAENLPFMKAATPESLERIRFAVLRVSGGDIDQLKATISVSKADWRDVLVAAGFAQDPSAHQRWLPRRLDVDTIQDWMSGVLPSGVRFGLNAAVDFRFGEHAGEGGAVISLTALEPEPRYTVELGTGQDVNAYQSELDDAG